MDRQEQARLQGLMVRLADGDRAAFQPMYEMLWPVVRGFAQRALQGTADVEDAAQSALMKVFARVSEFDRRRNALSWILGVASYECRTYRQRQRRRGEQGQPGAEPMDRQPGPEDALIARDLEAAALEVLGALRPADVETLQALIHDDRPVVAGATFRKRVQRAVARLRDAWSARHGLD